MRLRVRACEYRVRRPVFSKSVVVDKKELLVKARIISERKRRAGGWRSSKRDICCSLINRKRKRK